MKIREIRAKNPTAGKVYSVRDGYAGMLRGRGPLDLGSRGGHPIPSARYSALRASWTGDRPKVDCLFIADDCSWGFGTTSQSDASIETLTQ